jgi:hypothetical protein
MSDQPTVQVPDEERPMSRPPFDTAAFVFGTLFTVIAVIGLLDPEVARRIDLATFVPALLIVLGGFLLVGSALPRRRGER